LAAVEVQSTRQFAALTNDRQLFESIDTLAGQTGRIEEFNQRIESLVAGKMKHGVSLAVS
jgi:hypothetical protein